MKILLNRFFKLLFGEFHRIYRIVKPYLKAGTYQMDFTFSTIYSKKKKENTTFDQITFQKGHIFFGFLSYFFRFQIKGETAYKGEKIFISSSRREYKIFDFTNQKVFTYFIDDKKKREILHRRELLLPFFNVPSLIEIQQNLIIEKYIEKIPCYIESLFIKIIELYKVYFTKVNCCYQRKQTPYFVLHGDLWSSNIIYHNEQIYMVDFEKVSIYPYYYDLLFFIFTEAYIQGNFCLLDNYFKGEYDEQFEQIHITLFLEKFSIHKKEIFRKFLQLYEREKWNHLPLKVQRKNKKKLFRIKQKYDI